MTDHDSRLKHSVTLARRPNKCITLSRTNLSNTANSSRFRFYNNYANKSFIKLTPGRSPSCNFKRVYMRIQGAKGGRGAGFGRGGGDLTQPPLNFSKFLVVMNLYKKDVQTRKNFAYSVAIYVVYKLLLFSNKQHNILLILKDTLRSIFDHHQLQMSYGTVTFLLT